MRFPFVAILLATVSIGSGPAEAQSCSYAGFVDPCQEAVQVVPTGGTGVVAGTDLGAMPHGAFPATGMTWSTVPGTKHNTVFVTQGPYLHVVDLEQTQPVHTIDVASLIGRPTLTLNTADAGDPIVVQGNTIYELYVAGHFDAGYGYIVPWMVVLDQPTLLTGGSSPVLADFSVCSAGMFCVGDAVDIEASADLGGANPRRVYASVLFYETDMTTRTHRFTTMDRNSGAQGSWTFSFNPALEDTPWSGAEESAMGIEFDAAGVSATGVFQSASTTVALDTGSQSCTLSGDPTDIGVWTSPAHFDHDAYHFVTTLETGQDQLLVYAGDSCPVTDPDTLSIGVGNTPVALDISSRIANDLWVYTANTNSLSVAHLRLKNHGNGDTITLVSSDTEVYAGMCPTEIVFRDEGESLCLYGDPPGGPPGDCGLDPDDADCQPCEEVNDPENGEGGACALSR